MRKNNLSVLLWSMVLFVSADGWATNYQEDSFSFYLDLARSPNWTCSSTIHSLGRCYNNTGVETDGDKYGPNGLKIVKHGNSYYHYLQLKNKTGGPASQYEQASFVVFTSATGWHGQRGGLNNGDRLHLVNDEVRPRDGREWTVNHAFHDGTNFRIFAAHVENGGNTTYTTSRISLATTADGVSFGTNFNAWEEVLWAERTNLGLRLLAILVLPDPNNPGRWAGVLTWLDHGTKLNGSAPIRINPSAKTFDLMVGLGNWQEGLPFGTKITPSIKPYRLIPGRTMAFTKIDQGSVHEHVIWRVLKGEDRSGLSTWVPCPGGVPNAQYNQNMADWGGSKRKGAKLQHRTFNMSNLESQGSYSWQDYTSMNRPLVGDYPMFGTWIVDVVDYGQNVLVYWAGRDSHVCDFPNGIANGGWWDTAVGRSIYWSRATVTP